MKTLLGLVGSPRKYGNCELFVKEVFRNLSGDWELRMLRLPELDVRPCVACYQCLFGDMQCVQKDDMEIFIREWLSADALVLAVPTYFLGANASLKRVLDRGLSFYAHLDELWGKPAVGAAVAGIRGLEGHTKLAVDSFLRLIFADVRGSEVIYGALPGEIFLEGGAGTVAKRMAAALEASQAPLNEKEAGVPVCPLCGGDTFRFLAEETQGRDGYKIRCMTCSSEGVLRWDNGRISVRTRPGAHPLFFSLEDAKAHLEWLRTMKERFLEKRRELKPVVRSYSKVGHWVRPERKENSGKKEAT